MMKIFNYYNFLYKTKEGLKSVKTNEKINQFVTRKLDMAYLGRKYGSYLKTILSIIYNRKRNYDANFLFYLCNLLDSKSTTGLGDHFLLLSFVDLEILSIFLSAPYVFIKNKELAQAKYFFEENKPLLFVANAVLESILAFKTKDLKLLSKKYEVNYEKMINKDIALKYIDLISTAFGQDIIKSIKYGVDLMEKTYAISSKVKIEIQRWKIKKYCSINSQRLFFTKLIIDFADERGISWMDLSFCFAFDKETDNILYFLIEYIKPDKENESIKIFEYYAQKIAINFN